MKINKTISVALLSVFGVLLGVNCSSNNPTDSKIKEIYELAKDSGFKGTYEEWLESIKGEDGKDGHSPVVTIGSNGNWFVDGNDTGINAKGEDGAPGKDGVDGEDGQDGEQGPQGEQGESGKDGVSIVSIELTSSKDNIDTYTIKYSDGTFSNFTVTNGQDGTPGKDGFTPVVEIGENGNWIINGQDTGVKAKGNKGDQGVSINKIEKLIPKETKIFIRFISLMEKLLLLK